jgi:hypothetical protein
MGGHVVTRPWPKVKWTRAGQVAALVGDNASLANMLDLPPAEAFDRLRTHDKVAATHFIAQCLPRLDAVRWMANCLSGMAATNQARRLAARKAVNRWLAEPSDANRRLAYDAGDAAEFSTAEGCACLAVYFSGGSLAPPAQEQPVPPPPAAFGQALAGAVIMAALNDDPINMAARLALALDAAEALAAGTA